MRSSKYWNRSLEQTLASHLNAFSCYRPLIFDKYRMSKTNFSGRIPLSCCIALACSLLLSGCTAFSGWVSSSSFLPSSGPNRALMQEMQDGPQNNSIQIVDVTTEVAGKLLQGQKKLLFSETLVSEHRPSYAIGLGDVVEVSIWEAPPATLFGGGVPSGGSSVAASSGPATTRVTTFPEQMVNSEGTINIPFGGQVQIAGRTPQQIESDIARRLQGKANQPQVLVRVVKNNSSNVTVIGDVAANLRIPLTARGERLLDALAAAGGLRQVAGQNVTQSVNRTSLQITRNDQVQSLPLDTVIRDPKQNILLQPGDVVTALFQSLSFTVLGATGTNTELNFEAQGISLAQALARVGGLQDNRADANGIYIFRLEEGNALPWKTPPVKTPEGKVPVVYKVNLKDPATFFAAQNFTIQNKDVMYVANATGAELQKFLNLVFTALYPLIGVASVAKGL